MIQIAVNNSYSQITGLTSSQNSAIKKLLSYQDNPQAAYFSGGWNRTKYLIDKAGNFPTGLLPIVKKYLTDNHLKHEAQDLRQLPTTSVQFTPKFTYDAYPDQQHAVAYAVSAKRGIISMPTGTGKSHVIARLIARLNVRTLIVVPTLELKNQLSEDLTAIFGQTTAIRVENIDSNALKSLTAFDMLIVDEGHHSAAKTYQKLNKSVWKGIYYRFFMTATPFRNQSHENLLFEAIAGQVIYQLSYKDAVKKGYIVPIEAYYYDLPKKEVKGYTWKEVYSELVVNNVERNTLIQSLLLDLRRAVKSTLCLVKEIKHGENLEPFLFANGKDEDSRHLIEKFNTEQVSALIGTTGIIGEGVDTKPCEYVIIAGLGKAKSAFMQNVGRAVRKYKDKESAKVIIFRDPSHKWTLAHFNAQKKILIEEYGAVPIKLN